MPQIDMSHENIEKITAKQLRLLPQHKQIDEQEFYDLEVIEDMHENDELSPFECGFMHGYMTM